VHRRERVHRGTRQHFGLLIEADRADQVYGRDVKRVSEVCAVEDLADEDRTVEVRAGEV
jgi:hypothetical protein